MVIYINATEHLVKSRMAKLHMSYLHLADGPTLAIVTPIVKLTCSGQEWQLSHC